MVRDLGTGLVFESGNPSALQAAIDNITDNYTKFKSAVDRVDFSLRDQNQIDAYIKLLKE